MSERAWSAVVVGILAVVVGLFWWSGRQDPVVAVDRPLPELAAATLDGRRLDRAFFGDEPWLISVWMPG